MSPDKREKLTLTEHGDDARRFFEILRASGELVIQDGLNEYVVTVAPNRITDKARFALSRGGPIDD